MGSSTGAPLPFRLMRVAVSRARRTPRAAQRATRCTPELAAPPLDAAHVRALELTTSRGELFASRERAGAEARSAWPRARRALDRPRTALLCTQCLRRRDHARPRTRNATARAARRPRADSVRARRAGWRDQPTRHRTRPATQRADRPRTTSARRVGENVARRATRRLARRGPGQRGRSGASRATGSNTRSPSPSIRSVPSRPTPPKPASGIAHTKRCGARRDASPANTPTTTISRSAPELNEPKLLTVPRVAAVELDGAWTQKSPGLQAFLDADERTRTSTELPPHGPEPCASTNSATSA